MIRSGSQALRLSALIVLSAVLTVTSGARFRRQSAPTANDITISVAPGDTVFIPFSGSDPDGNLFGFFPTSAPSPASGGTFISVCFCRGFFPNVICACSSSFTASATFSGTVTFTYRAVDTTGLQSADATVTITVGSGIRTPGQVLDEIRHIIERAKLGGNIATQIVPSLDAKLRALDHSLIEGNPTSAFGQAGALCNEVSAQAGNFIAEPVFSVLLDLCDDLRFSIQEDPCPCPKEHKTFGKLLWEETRQFGIPGDGTISVKICRYAGGVVWCYPDTFDGKTATNAELKCDAQFPEHPGKDEVVARAYDAQMKAVTVVRKSGQDKKKDRYWGEAKFIVVSGPCTPVLVVQYVSRLQVIKDKAGKVVGRDPEQGEAPYEPDIPESEKKKDPDKRDWVYPGSGSSTGTKINDHDDVAWAFDMPGVFEEDIKNFPQPEIRKPGVVYQDGFTHSNTVCFETWIVCKGQILGFFSWGYTETWTMIEDTSKEPHVMRVDLETISVELKDVSFTPVKDAKGGSLDRQKEAQGAADRGQKVGP